MIFKLYAVVYKWTKDGSGVFITHNIPENQMDGKSVSFELDIPMDKLFPIDVDLGTIDVKMLDTLEDTKDGEG